MKKAFTDPTLEPVLFGFDVITTSGVDTSIDGNYDTDSNSNGWNDINDPVPNP